MNSTDLNTSHQVVEDTIFYRIEIVLFLSDSFPPENLFSEGNDSDTYTGSSEDTTPSASTALTTPETLSEDKQSVYSSNPPSILSEYEAESDLTIPDDESSDEDDAGSVNGTTNNPLGNVTFLEGLVQVFTAIGLHNGLLTGPLPPLQPQAPGTFAPPSTPVTGPVSQPVGGGIDDLGSVIAQSAHLAHLAAPAGAGTPVSAYNYDGGASSVSSLGISDSESDPGAEGAGCPVDDGSRSGSDVSPESPAHPPNFPVLAGILDGPGSDAAPAASPARRSNLNAASAPFVPSGTFAGPSSAPGPQEPPSHPQGQGGGSASYTPDLDIYAVGSNGYSNALPVLAPEYALGEAMSWEAACPLGVSEARKAQVRASPLFQSHGKGYGVGDYGGGQGQVLGGVSGYHRSGYGGEFAAGEYASQSEPESGFYGSGAGGYRPAEEPQSGYESGFNGLGLDGRYARGYVQPGLLSGFDGSGDYTVRAYVQRPDGTYAVVYHAPEYPPQPAPARRYAVSGEGRMVWELRADGSSTAIGAAPRGYWGGSELPPELLPQSGPEAKPEPEPEGEAVPVRNGYGTVGFDVPRPPPGHHVAILWGDGPNPEFRYIFLEDAPDEDEDQRLF